MDQRVTELHCIMPMANIASVMEHGILSYEGSAKLHHRSVALQPVQDRRDQKRVPGGLKLHQYANLYFHARNPMLYKRKDDAADLCILRISVALLEGDGVVITDCNAASDYVRFLATSTRPTGAIPAIPPDTTSTGPASALKSWFRTASNRTT